MLTCEKCPKAANVKRVVRDEWQRPRDVYLCDTHALELDKSIDVCCSQKEYMERRGYRQ